MHGGIRELVTLLRDELDAPPPWLRGATVVAIGGFNSLFAVALRALSEGDGEEPAPQQIYYIKGKVVSKAHWESRKSVDDLKVFTAVHDFIHPDPDGSPEERARWRELQAKKKKKRRSSSQSSCTSRESGF